MPPKTPEELREQIDAQNARCCDEAYFCPTSGEIECARHGGFDVCCDRPDLHQPLPAVGRERSAEGLEVETPARSDFFGNLDKISKTDS